MQVCTSLQTDNDANTSPLSFFTGPSCRPTNSVKALKAANKTANIKQVITEQDIAM